MYSGDHEGDYLDNSLFDIHFFDDVNGVAVGAKGHKVFTTDGGNTWSLAEFNTNDENLLDIIPVNLNTAFIIGENSIHKTIDKGTTWSSVSSPSVDRLQTGHFFDEFNGIVSSSFAIYRTSDGGQTWLKNPLSKGGSKMFFLNQSEGYLIDSNSLLKTIDGGTFWEAVVQQFPVNIGDLHFFDSNNGFAIGDYGYLAKTISGSGTTRPLAMLEASPFPTCLNQTVLFRNFGKPTDSYSWFVDGQLVANSYDFQYTVTSLGDHEVKLRVTRGIYTDENKVTFGIYIPQTPHSFEILASKYRCAGSPFYGKVYNSQYGVHYSFKVNGQNVIDPMVGVDGDFNFNIPQGFSENTILKVTAYIPYPCADISRSVDFPIGIIPSDYELDISRPAFGCEKTPIKIVINNSKKGVYYKVSSTIPGTFSFGSLEGTDGPLEFNFDPISENQTFTVEASLPCSLAAPPITFELVAQPLPKNNFGLPSNGFYLDEDIIITNNSRGGSIFDWDLGDNLTSTLIEPPSFRYNTVGRKNIQLTVTNDFDCQVTKDTVIYISNRAQVSSATTCMTTSETSPETDTRVVLDSEIDSQGNFFQTGYILSSFENEPFIFFLEKYNRQGHREWFKSGVGIGNNSNFGSVLTVDNEGSVIVNLHLEYGTFTIYGTPAIRYPSIIKYSGDGSYQWHVQFSDVSISDIQMANNGDIVAAGYSSAGIVNNAIVLEDPQGLREYGFVVIRFHSDGTYKNHILIPSYLGPYVETVEPLTAYALSRLTSPKILVDNNDRIVLAGIQRPARSNLPNNNLKFGNFTLTEGPTARIFMAIYDQGWTYAAQGPAVNTAQLFQHLREIEIDEATQSVFLTGGWTRFPPNYIVPPLVDPVMQYNGDVDVNDADGYLMKWKYNGQIEWIKYLRGVQFNKMNADSFSNTLFASATIRNFGVFDCKSNSAVAVRAQEGSDAAIFSISHSGTLNWVFQDVLDGDQYGIDISDYNCGQLTLINQNKPSSLDPTQLYTKRISPGNSCNENPPLLQVNHEIITICKGSSAQLEVSGASSYVWAPSVNLSNHLIANPVAVPLSTTSYTVFGFTGNCYAAKTIKVVVENPVVDFIFEKNNYQVAFHSGTNHVVNWDFGDQITSTESNPVHIYQSTGTYHICMTTTDVCQTTICKDITIVCPKPTIDFSFQQNARTFEFSTPIIQGTTLSWSFGDGTSSTSQSPQHQFSTVSSTDVCLTATNACGSTSVCKTVVPCNKPVVDFSFQQNARTFDFSTPIIQGTTLSWSFGDGTAATSASPQHQFSAAGSFEVCLTATNTCGSTSVCKTVVPCNKPVVDFSFQQNALKFDFSTPAVQGTTFSWNFGDGTNSTSSNPQHQFSAAGSFEVCLTATNTCGSTSVCKTVVPCNKPVVDFSLQQNTRTFDFSTPIIQGTTFSWNFGDGTSSTSPSPQHQFSAAGSFEVCLTATNTCGSTSVCKTVVPCNKPLIDFSFQQNAQTFDFSTPIIQGTTFSWNFGGGTNSTSSSPQHQFSAAGSFEVCLTATNTCGSTSVCKTVVPCNKPVIDFSFQQNARTFDFSTPIIQGTTFSWNFGDGATATSASPQHQFSAAGSFEVCLTAKNACGSIVICKTVVPCNKPVVDFSFQQNAQTFDFSTPIIQGTTFSWNFGDGTNSTSSSPQHQFSAAGSFEVCLTATNACGSTVICKTVVPCNKPVVDFSFQQNARTFEFSTPIIQGTTFSWNFGDGTNSASPSPQHQFSAAGSFEVCLTATNACGSTVICKTVVVCDDLSGTFDVSISDQTVQFSDAVHAASKWVWDFGDGSSSTSENPSHTYAKQGTYTT